MVDATLHGLDGEIFELELRRVCKQLRTAETTTGVVRSALERRAAALVEMATRSAAMPADARRARPLFTVVVGDESFARLCETSLGHLATVDALARHVDTALLEVVLFDGPMRAVGVSTRRSFSGALRRAIQVRDRHCQHPSGCDVPAERCDVDHIVPWPESQRTDQNNGRLECEAHNRYADLHDSDAQPLGPPPEPIDWNVIRITHDQWRHHPDRHRRDDDDPYAATG